MPLPADSDVSDDRVPLTGFLSDLLQSPTLMLLCGLGTSLHLAHAPTMDDLWSAVADLPDFGQVLSDTRWPSGDDRDVEALLSRCDMLASLDDESACAKFRPVAERKIFELCHFVDPSSSLQPHQDLLRRVARRSARLPRTQIFTTNYDTAIETAAASLGYLIVDGFSYTTPRTFDPAYFDYDFVRRGGTQRRIDFVPEVFILHKLHGSVSWNKTSTGVVQADVVKVPVLIFPRQSKYELSYELPFLESMSRFQTGLRQPNVGLLIIGSGLRDKHLVEPILACLRSNPTARVAVVDPGVHTTSTPGHRVIRTVAERGDPRLALISATFDQFVTLLPDLAPLSEAERQERVVHDLLAANQGDLLIDPDQSEGTNVD